MDTNNTTSNMELAGMLHEMKSPLTNIKLCIELIESGEEPNEDYFAMIKKNAIALEKDISQMYNYFSQGSSFIKTDHENNRYNGYHEYRNNIFHKY